MSTALENADILAKLQPVEYYKKWIDNYYPMRPDQRNILSFRPIVIQSNSIQTADASTTVRLGGTTVIGALKYEVAEPSLDDPNSGYLVCNVTLCAGCSPQVRAGPPSERAQMLTTQMTTLIQRIVPPTTLCIIPGKLSWVLYLDAFVLNDEGNVFDAVWMALLTVLRNIQLPSIRINDDGMIYANDTKMEGLPMTCTPLPISFGYLAEKNELVADPNHDELAIMDGACVNILTNPKDYSIFYLEASRVPLSAIKSTLQKEEVKAHVKHLLDSLANS